MTIREAVERSYLKRSGERLTRDEQRAKDRRDINKMVFWAVLPGLLVYVAGTVLSVVLRLYLRG